MLHCGKGDGILRVNFAWNHITPVWGRQYVKGKSHPKSRHTKVGGVNQVLYNGAVRLLCCGYVRVPKQSNIGNKEETSCFHGQSFEAWPQGCSGCWQLALDSPQSAWRPPWMQAFYQWFWRKLLCNHTYLFHQDNNASRSSSDHDCTVPIRPR